MTRLNEEMDPDGVRVRTSVESRGSHHALPFSSLQKNCITGVVCTERPREFRNLAWRVHLHVALRIAWPSFLGQFAHEVCFRTCLLYTKSSKKESRCEQYKFNVV